MQKVRIFDYKIDQLDRESFFEKCQILFDDGYLTNHHLVERFEKKSASLLQSPYALGVNNGTSALLASLQSLDLENKEVILPVNTFIACWLAVRQAGGIPVLADIQSHSFTLSLDEIKKHRTPKTKAILYVHIGGSVSTDIQEIAAFCKQENLFLIEDCSHSFTASLHGKRTGTFGDFGTFSFHLTKPLTGGEGGLITTSSPDLFEKVTSIRQFGKSKENPHLFERFGGNYKMTELQAALLLTDLDRFEGRRRRRQEIAEFYFQHLKSEFWNFLVPEEPKNSTFYKVICQPLAKRERVTSVLGKWGIQLPNGVYFWPLHQQPVVQQAMKLTNAYPNADHFAQNHICLPCYPEITDEQLTYLLTHLLEIQNDAI